MNRKFIGVTLMAMGLLLSACGGGTLTDSYLRENASLAHIEKLAVLPFENIGGSGAGAKRVREFTITEVLAEGLFDVVDKGRVDSALQDELIEPGMPLNAVMLKRLGQRLGVQGFILGSVEETSQSRGNANFIELTLTLRLIDSETGVLLWQASGRTSGYSLADRLFGASPKDSFIMTMELLRELLATIR